MDAYSFHVRQLEPLKSWKDHSNVISVYTPSSLVALIDCCSSLMNIDVYVQTHAI